MFASAPTEGQDESSATLPVDDCERIERKLSSSKRMKQAKAYEVVVRWIDGRDQR